MNSSPAQFLSDIFVPFLLNHPTLSLFSPEEHFEVLIMPFALDPSCEVQGHLKRQGLWCRARFNQNLKTKICLN
jgi:hypothetical protein